MKTRPVSDDLNLRNALPQVPQDCYDALMNAARSVKEEEKMKRFSMRTALIAAALIVVTMAVAVAATQLGLNDLFKNSYNIALPETAQSVLSATEQKTYSVGPVAMTLRETLADGHLVYVTCQAQPEKEKTALVMDQDSSLDEAISDALAAYLNVEKGATFTQAAQQAGLSLYQASAYLTMDFDLLHGEEMMASVYGGDGSVLLVDMLQTKPGAVGDSVTGMLTMSAWEIDPATGERMEGKEWTTTEEITIPVNGATEEKTYAPEGDAQLLGFKLQSVRAEKTCAGVYLYATFQAPQGAEQETAYDLYQLEYMDEKGASFPGGISLSGGLDENAVWPTVILESMLNLDTLPESLTLVDPATGDAVTVK